MPVEEQVEILSEVTKVSEESTIHDPYIVQHDYEMIIYKDKDRYDKKDKA